MAKNSSFPRSSMNRKMDGQMERMTCTGWERMEYWPIVDR